MYALRLALLLEAAAASLAAFTGALVCLLLEDAEWRMTNRNMRTDLYGISATYRLALLLEEVTDSLYEFTGVLFI